MAWSKSNLPASAKKLKGHSADIFVAAANAALEQYNGDEGRAIATGLSAVKKHRDKLKETKKSTLDDGVMASLFDKFKEMIAEAFAPVQGNVSPSVEVTKSVDVEQRRAMFVALAPNEVDAHGDINTEEAVEKACISFNTLCNKANLFHRVMTQDVVIEQSYITPAAFTTDSGIEVKKGSWIQWMHFPDNNPNSELLWKMVKDGEIQGISVGATAVYEEINQGDGDA